ncbi:Toll-like receptor e [Elysia marginata]|uniref:Toll-like receptor e n=1 Tax=Elysia marginata TaxID=1093978 RepID=A0AAV4FKJ3_9GAST|nr:Toll-like receptor e [Elysia marginata]
MRRVKLTTVAKFSLNLYCIYLGLLLTTCAAATAAKYSHTKYTGNIPQALGPGSLHKSRSTVESETFWLQTSATGSHEESRSRFDPTAPESPSVPLSLSTRDSPRVFASRDQCELLNAVYLNCSARNWDSVPTAEFPAQIQVYDLSKNFITALPSHAFSRYSSLLELKLNDNRISVIDPLAFVGLSNLEVLNMFSNDLVMNETTLANAFSENVFVPLRNLKKLRLERNNPNPDEAGLRYPHKALSHLTSLEELCLDGFTNAVFESGFSNLTRLRNLSLDGYIYGHCKLSGLGNKTFEHLTSLHHLSITDCRLQGHRIEPGAFSPLTNLTSLNISMNQDINVQFFDRVFYGLQNSTTLKTLHMQFVVNLYTLGVCLSSRYIKYFPRSVQYLDARENKLECVDRNVMNIIKNSLTELDISKNSFVFGTYLLDLPKLEHLTSLSVDDYQLYANSLPHIYPFNPQTPPLEADNCSLYARNEGDVENQEFVLRLPPNLKVATVRYASMRYVFTRLEVDANNSLESLTIEGNYIPILEGPISGLHKLKNCHFVANKIYKISEYFFEPFSSLERLNLSSNRLGEFLEDNPGTKVFQNLVHLTSLDLASNTIRVLGQTIFSGLIKLEYLSISHNPIYRFYPDISRMHQLQAFIATDTSLSFLSEETRNAITQRVENGSSFHVDLQLAPIFCDCQNVAFVEWMVRSKVFNFTNTQYFCHYPDTSSIIVHDGYTAALRELHRECTSHAPLFLAVGALTIVVILLVIVALAYRYRWKLRYMYHAAYNHLRPERDSNDSLFEHDVFVCYAEENRQFVTDVLHPALEARGLNVFVHHRHFRAGELICDNIVRAVNTCKRTVVVLTRALATSSWCNYEIQMANQETARRGKPVLIFLLFDDMGLGEMSPELLYNVQNSTYIQFPSCPVKNDHTFETQWDKLARDIKN